jgi:pimeloyl-ACP methyl ester carboxylesterase
MSPAGRPTHLRIPIADTVLDGSDSGGESRAVIFLNGAFGTQRDWKKVLSKLGKSYRTITYDERARGKSKKSKDYSFAGCLDDLSAVIAATGVRRPLLLGWSMGAAIAVLYAASHPDEVGGLLLIDGAYPIASYTEADREQARRTFRKMAWLLPIAALLRKAARMSASQAAGVNIELHEVLLQDNIGPVYDRLTCPALFVCASKPAMGGAEDQFRKMRASVEQLIVRHHNISLYKTLPCTHLDILSKYPGTIAEAINELSSKAP